MRIDNFELSYKHMYPVPPSVVIAAKKHSIGLVCLTTITRGKRTAVTQRAGYSAIRPGRNATVLRCLSKCFRVPFATKSMGSKFVGIQDVV